MREVGGVGENDIFIPSIDLASEHGVAPIPYFPQFGITLTTVGTSSKSHKVNLELLLAQRCGCPNSLLYLKIAKNKGFQ
jgi:hypothetical protein